VIGPSVASCRQGRAAGFDVAKWKFGLVGVSGRGAKPRRHPCLFVFIRVPFSFAGHATDHARGREPRTGRAASSCRGHHIDRQAIDGPQGGEAKKPPGKPKYRGKDQTFSVGGAAMSLILRVPIHL